MLRRGRVLLGNNSLVLVIAIFCSGDAGLGLYLLTGGQNSEREHDDHLVDHGSSCP